MVLVPYLLNISVKVFKCSIRLDLNGLILINNLIFPWEFPNVMFVPDSTIRCQVSRRISWIKFPNRRWELGLDQEDVNTLGLIQETITKKTLTLQKLFLSFQKNWVLASNSNFQTYIFAIPEVVDFGYFKLELFKTSKTCKRTTTSISFFCRVLTSVLFKYSWISF